RYLQPHHAANHVVEESVGGNFKNKLVARRRPAGGVHRANGVAALLWHRAAGYEVVLATRVAGGRLQAAQLWRRPHPPGEPLPKWVSLWLAVQAVAVCSLAGMVAGVKLRPHLLYRV